ncbi:hypothetical protein [Hyphobacterium sp.]|jgi:TolB-like protein|uniref:hypothetical protein n=1 Tax=Hyphobacterium sp. TaxID=2004662 RepID=UPI003BAD4C7A
MTAFLAELRRRQIFRVAAAYLVAGWIIMQVIATIGDAAGLPDTADSLALIILIAGFPVVVFIAWAFELTPEGLKRTRRAVAGAAVRPFGSTDLVLIGLLVAVIGIAGYQVLTRPGASQDVGDSAAIVESAGRDRTSDAAEAGVSDASIAVLPFADFSPDGDQQYFSDGIAEELLNELAQFPDLRVAARTSAFAFRGDDINLQEAGAALGVAHILEGSVRRSEDRLRITAQLIRVSDGYHLWSDTYERTFADLFDVQDEIVGELARVLQVRLGVGGAAGRAGEGTADPQAYEQYLRGLSYWAGRDDITNRTRAVEAFETAHEIDPEFADAWAAHGVSITISGVPAHGLDPETLVAEAGRIFDRALALDPDNPRAHAGLGWMHVYRQPDIDTALFHANRAVEIAPNAGYAHYALGVVQRWAGDYVAADRHFLRASSLDPLNATLSRVFAEARAADGDVAGVERIVDQCATCIPQMRPLLTYTAIVQSGSEAEALAALEDAIAALRELNAGLPEAQWNEQAGQIRAMADYVLGRPVDPDGRASVLEILQQAAAAEVASVDLVALAAMMGEIDLAIDFLFDAYGSAAMTDFEQYLRPGRLTFADSLRRDPRYHEFWALPGMAELATMRESRGETAGLPLPTESALGGTD